MRVISSGVLLSVGSINMKPSELEKKIAKALKLTHGEKVFNKGALARKSWYCKVEIEDYDTEEVTITEYINFDDEVKAILTALKDSLPKEKVSRYINKEKVVGYNQCLQDIINIIEGKS